MWVDPSLTEWAASGKENRWKIQQQYRRRIVPNSNANSITYCYEAAASGNETNDCWLLRMLFRRFWNCRHLLLLLFFAEQIYVVWIRRTLHTAPLITALLPSIISYWVCVSAIRAFTANSTFFVHIYLSLSEWLLSPFHSNIFYCYSSVSMYLFCIDTQQRAIGTEKARWQMER